MLRSYGDDFVNFTRAFAILALLSLAVIPALGMLTDHQKDVMNA